MSVNILLRWFFLGYLLLLTACGGGGGGSGGGNTGNITTVKAVLLDGVAQGVRYDAGSGVTGVTDADGVFYYVEGQPVSFYLGNILLGRAVPIDRPNNINVLADKIVTPLGLAGSNANLDDPQVLNRVRLLLTLDADGKPDNGIQIASSVVDALQNITSLSFDDPFDPAAVLQAARSASGQSMTLVDSTTAKQHLCDSLQRDCTSGGGNHAPTISGTPATSVNVGSVYSFTPASTDEDAGDSKTFSINKTPSWATLDTTMGKLSGTPAAADVGTTSGIVISVKDSKDASASLTAFDLTVVQPNRAPTIGGTPATSVKVGSAYSFTPAAEDLDGDAQTFSITNKPSWASFSTSTGALTGTTTAADVGITSNIIISVTDGKSLSVALPAFNLAVIAPVTPLNLAPYCMASQSTTYSDGGGSYPASNAIDGNTNTYNHANCQSGDWWQLELKSESHISEVVVTNRGAVVNSRLNGTTVYISNTPASNNTWSAAELVKTLTSDATQTVTVDPARSARYVIIKTNGSACLHMAEVAVKGIGSDTLEFSKTSYAFEVKHRTAQGGAVGTVKAIQYAGRAVTYSIDGTVPFAIDAQGNITVTGELNRETYTFTVKGTDGLGTVSVPVTVQAPFNLALEFGIATQSSTYNSSSAAGNAIDDKLETTNHTNCEVGDWWQVKLPAPTLVSRIVVTGRDTWTSRLNGAEVYVSANSATNGGMSAGDKVFTLADTANAQKILLATPKSGTYVIVKAVPKTGGTECLHMREVEVYGQAPPAPALNLSAYSFQLSHSVAVGQFVVKVNAVDYQKDAITYSLTGARVPFAIDAQGNITVSGALQAGTTYNFTVTASDGVNTASAPVVVVVTSISSVADALSTGDASVTTEQELVTETNATVTAIKSRQAQSIKSIFKLAADGSLAAGSVTGIDWDPSHDSVWFDSLSMGENFPILVSNVAAKQSSSLNKNLALAGIKDNGARYAVFGENPLHDLTRTSQPGGTANSQMQAFLKSTLEWLTQRSDLATRPFKVVVAHQPDDYWFKHDATTHQWFANAYPSTVTVNAQDACENTALVNCLTGADLLVIGQEDGTYDTNYTTPVNVNATVQAVKDAQAQGIPVLYLQYDGGMTALGKSLMAQFGLTTTDNYWRQEKLVGFVPTSLLSANGGSLDAIQTVINALAEGALNFGFSDTNCVNNVGTVTCDPTTVIDATSGNTMQTQFTGGVEAVRTALNALDGQGINLFEQSDGFRLLKVVTLLADKYRANIQYPMDKSTTDNTTFFKALFADYAVHYARSNNIYQPDMGDFTDAQVDLNSQSGISKTLTYTPTGFDEWTSTGLYAPPGKSITIRRTDASSNTVKLKFNYLRESTRLWNDNQYSRPRYMTSPVVTLQVGQTYTFSTPYGGPIYLGWTGAASSAVPFTVEFSNVLDNPLLTAFDDTSIQTFLSAVISSNSDWADIKTPYAEIHTLKSNMLSAFAKQDGNSSNGYTTQDVKDYIDDLNSYLIAGNYAYAGFTGVGLPSLDAEVQAFCSSMGLVSVNYGSSIKNLCTDAVIHAKPKIQHINSDVNAACGALCSGNPFDSGSPIMPVDWGENHEMGHNLQRERLKVYSGRSTEVSNNMFPLHTQWKWTVAQNLAKHPTQDRPSNQGAFTILQAAIGAGTTANSSHPLWSGTGTYDNAFERLSFYMQLAYTQQSWDVYTKMYLMDRILSDAVKDTSVSNNKWDAVKGLLGMGNYNRTDASNLNGNDFMYLAASKIAGKDYSNYFAAWGIEVSAAAKTQVALNGFTTQVPNLFYYVNNELPAVMPTLPDTIPLDGTSGWVDPPP
ncbi:MAG: ImpA family metalloprotease [Thiothrix sp.]|uniref:ImpA family metalloprotease n=1 Tax=Thiothrix sp. TaxID=1032 RepID=UPI00261A7433|nr:ImpA family metalloprotease [Thiothrix sp.]MDD5393834.1 ImpA family metalloprotease [Thiothrix sp.]